MTAWKPDYGGCGRENRAVNTALCGPVSLAGRQGNAYALERQESRDRRASRGGHVRRGSAEELRYNMNFVDDTHEDTPSRRLRGASNNSAQR